MGAKKVYRIYIDRNSAIFELLERIPRALRGEYIREALIAFKPFEVRQADSDKPGKKESRTTVPASDTFNTFG